MATTRVSACSFVTMSYLSSGFASGLYSSIPTSLAMLFAVRGWSPVNMTGRIPITLTDRIFSLMPGFRTSLSRITPIISLFLVTASGVSPRLEILSTMASKFDGMERAIFLIASGAPGKLVHFRNPQCVQLSRNETILVSEPNQAPAFESIIMPRREKRRFTNLLLSVIVDGDEFYRLSVADRDRSGLVKDDHIRISCSLNCSS